MKTHNIEVWCEHDFGGSLEDGRGERITVKAETYEEAKAKVKAHLLENTCIFNKEDWNSEEGVTAEYTYEDYLDDYVNFSEVDEASVVID